MMLPKNIQIKLISYRLFCFFIYYVDCHVRYAEIDGIAT